MRSRCYPEAAATAPANAQPVGTAELPGFAGLAETGVVAGAPAPADAVAAIVEPAVEPAVEPVAGIVGAPAVPAAVKY